jgi:hypothetical protein
MTDMVMSVLRLLSVGRFMLTSSQTYIEIGIVSKYIPKVFFCSKIFIPV